jgi:hypothetical protein
VGAGAGVDALRFSHQSTTSPNIYDNDISGNSRHWSLSAGGKIARHGVLQVEFSRTSELTRDIAPTQFNPPCPTCGISKTTARYRSRQLAVLAGYSWGRHRVSVSALGGLAFVAQTLHSLSTYTPAPPTPVILSLPSESGFHQYVIGPEFGLDVPIALARHLALVPQARIYRPGNSESYFGASQLLVTSFGAEGRVTF